MVRRRGFAAVLALVATAATARAGTVDDAKALSRADRRAEAEALLLARVAEAPDDAAAYVALGDVERLRCRLGPAEAAYRRAVERDLSDPGARAGLAEVLLLGGRAAEALAEVQAALPPAVPLEDEDARPWRVKALCLVELRRYDLAVAAARRAVALDPTSPRAIEALAASEFRRGRMDEARRWYERAVALDPRTEEANLRLGNGFGPAVAGKPWRDGADAERFAAAVAAWEARDLAGAEKAFLDLCRDRPESYKYRLGLGLVRLSSRRAQEAWLGRDAPILYAFLDAPEVEGLEKVVRGYASLPELERRVVRVSTAPAKPFWPALVAAGDVHDVLPLAADLADDASRHDLAGRRTFDGRWYEHLRGVGGTRAATGAEKLREAAEFAFNTFAHEFGHQVHRHGLTKEQQAEVDGLYAAATKAGKTLDYYAASNADEYFAQGYEAFVSPLKRGCLTETGRHTRAELGRKDPDLHAFLLRVLDVSHESPDALAALLSAAAGGASVQAEPDGSR
jgi:Flp pilus assembly protein TadD